MSSKSQMNKKALHPEVDDAAGMPADASTGSGGDAKAIKLQPPTVQTRAQNVTERLREAILAGHFAPNEKLQEVSLSEMLDVSRTPIRAALHGLSAEGLLEYEPNRGYSVRRLDAEELIAVFDIRGALEGLAARFAAERGLSAEAQETYRIALADGDRILSKGRLVKEDISAFREVNVRIHNTIIQAAGNRMIGDMIRICLNVPMSSDRNVLWDDYRWTLRSHDDHHRIFDAMLNREATRAEHDDYRWTLRSHDDHHRIFDAMLNREAARAEQLMREHVHTVKVHLKRQLESGSGDIGTPA